MTTRSPHPVLASCDDATLLDRTRGGDMDAYAELWSRHAGAANRMARGFRGNWSSEDLVSEGYVRVLDLLRRGKGPEGAFRPYLFAVVRSIAQAWSKRVSDTIEEPDTLIDPASTENPAERSHEFRMTREAFAALPQRWQSVLWYTEVEQMTPQQVSTLLGMTPNSVSALAYRAREALRANWIAAHLADATSTDPACADTLARLGDYTQERLSPRNRARVDAHLRSCATCAQAGNELREVRSSLALAILGPIVGLTAGGSYLVGFGQTTAVAAAVPIAGTAAAGSAATTPTWVASGIAAACIAVAATGAVTSVTSAPQEAAAASPVRQEQVLAEFPPAPVEQPLPAKPVQPPAGPDPARVPEVATEPPASPAPPPAMEPVPVPGLTGAISDTAPERPWFVGTGVPGSLVQIVDSSGALRAEATVDAEGNWDAGRPYIDPATTGFTIDQRLPSGQKSDVLHVGPFAFRPQLSATEVQCTVGGVAGYSVYGWAAETVLATFLRDDVHGSTPPSTFPVDPDSAVLMEFDCEGPGVTVIEYRYPGAAEGVSITITASS